MKNVERGREQGGKRFLSEGGGERRLPSHTHLGQLFVCWCMQTTYAAVRRFPIDKPDRRRR